MKRILSLILIKKMWLLLVILSTFTSMFAIQIQRVSAIETAWGSTLLLDGGSGTFASVSAANPTIYVSPGQALSGTVTLIANNNIPPNCVVPLIGTPSWGENSNSWWLIHSWLPYGSSVQTANVQLSAPSQAGTYYIIFAFRGELTGAQMASATNWNVGYLVWNDGNDIADFSSTQISEAQQNGVTVVNWLYAEGYLLTYTPACAITVVVGGAQVHDVAVTGVVASQSQVTVGDSLPVSVTVRNFGTQSETFSVTAYFGSGKIGFDMETVTLEADGTRVLSMAWDTTGVAPNSYQIGAYASQVPGETNFANNDYSDGSVVIKGLPYSPQNLVADPVDAFAIGRSLAIHLWWESPQSAPYSLQGYKIYRGPSSTQKTLIIIVDSSKTDYLDHVEVKGIYYYHVVAVYAQGDSVPSNEAACAPMESFSGIENVVHLDSLNVGPGEWIPHVFTIQQNVKIPLFTSVVANWGYWVQNVIWVDPNKMWMGGSIQVFEIWNNEIGKFPFARFPQTYPVPYYRVGKFNNTVALKMTIEGDTLRIINPCNWQSFDLKLPTMGAGYHFLSVWTTWRENAPFTTMVYDKSPELVIVDNPINQKVPGSTGVHFGPGTSGSVDSYIRVDTTSGSQWLRCTTSGVVGWGQASTAEESTGLHWEKSGSFTYNAAYDSPSTAEEGLWCWPDYYNTVADVPSITWAPGLTSLSINIFCPAYLNLYDHFGNLLGYDPTRKAFVDQIPLSVCFSNQSLLVVDPSGVYRVEVIGVEDGGVTLQITWQNEMGDSTTVWNTTETVNKGQMIDYYVFAWSSGVPIISNASLAVSILPLSSSIHLGQTVSFSSATYGGFPPYSYQWYLNGAPATDATSASWTFTPTSSGIYYVSLKVTDAIGNMNQSETARIVVTTVPVGGYSIPVQTPATLKPLTPYLILTAILTIAYTTIKRKTTRKPKQQ